ncbi:MAG: lipopolysaccharide biosynthesis protein [Vicinamibacterales bacterium]
MDGTADRESDGRSQAPARNSVAEQIALVRAIGANGLTVAAMSARALFGVLTARLFGGPALGAFVLAATWIDLLGQIGVLGLDSGAMIRSAQAHGQHDGRAVRRIFRFALAVSAAASSLLAAGLIVAAMTGQLRQLPGAGGLEALFIVMALSLPALAVGRVSAQVARGLQVVHHDLYAQGTVGTAVMVAGLLAGYALGVGPLSPAVALTLGTITGGVIAWRMTSRLIERERASGPPGRSTAGDGLARFSLPIAAFHFVDVLAMRADVLLLGVFVGRSAGVTVAALGVYCAVWEVAATLRKFRQVFDLALTPAAARSRSQAGEAGARQQSGQVGRWLLALIGPAVCVMMLGAGAILSLYGPGFEAGSSWLGVLALAAGTRGILVALDSRLIVSRPGLNLLNGVVAVSMQAGASLVLIPRHGPMGAAAAALMAAVVRAVMTVVQIRMLEHWWWPVPALRRPAVAMAFALVPGIVVHQAWPGSIGALASAVIFVAGYIGMWKVVRLDADDRMLIKTIRGRVPQLP